MNTKAAFTLVELSIVLVILGLLVGGVLAGQNLIRAAELRTISTQVSQYRTAVYAFKEKYFAIPGDMTNATAFWGSAGGTGNDATCVDAQDESAATCNGDGDGRIKETSVITSGNHERYEQFTFWKHLNNAGLAGGSFTGKTDHNTNQSASIIGLNVPQSVGGGCFTAWSAQGGSTDWSTLTSDPKLTYGIATTNNPCGGVILTPEELWSIDRKTDDGAPGTGGVLTSKEGAGASGSATGCADTDAPATAVYNVSDTAITCAGLFLIL